MIFVFSGTGNSYHAAKMVSESLGIGMIDIAAAVRYKRYIYDAKGEDVGFVFPVYFLGLPRMVSEFAENLQVRNPGRVFCVLTIGGESGIAYEMLQEKLGNRLKIDACHDVVMPDNAVFAFDLAPKEANDACNAAADARIKEIVEELKSGAVGDLRRNSTKKGDEAKELYAKYDEMRTTECFTIDDTCIECRVCEEVCPEQAIRVYHRKPVWDEDSCSLCMGCMNMCPKAAIQYGDSTASRGRYYHPDYKNKVLGIPLKY